MFLFIQKMMQQKKDVINCLSGHFKGHLMSSDQLTCIQEDFLKDPVVAVHCKAGKGRTGLIICCFMLFTNQFQSVEESLNHYDETRTTNGKALTIQSQIRQVYHFKHFLDRVCVQPGRDPNRGGKGQYVLSALRNYKHVLTELDKMENCEEFQYKNSLNIFSLTLGPFE